MFSLPTVGLDNIVFFFNCVLKCFEPSHNFAYLFSFKEGELELVGWLRSYFKGKERERRERKKEGEGRKRERGREGG